MSSTYTERRQRFISAHPGYASLLPERPPSRPPLPPLDRRELRQHLGGAASNHAETLFLLGWGDGSLLRAVLDDPLLRQKRIHQVLVAGEEPAFAATLSEFDAFTAFGQANIDLSRLEDSGQVESWTCERYSRHDRIPTLAGADLIDSHPVLPAAAGLRSDLAREMRRSLADRPQQYGNDILDTFTGLYQSARNAHLVLPGPNVDEFAGLHGPAPVISIGAGPSVKGHLDRLRALQGRCILVACDSALKGLLAAGIEPDYCTPIERVPEIIPKVAGVQLTRCRFAGLPLLVPEVMAAFAGREHLAVWGGDDLYRWLDPQHQGAVMTGSSTGVLSASVAACLGQGPVYLVGHDLAMEGRASHWDAAATSADDFDKLVAARFGKVVVDSGNAERLLPGNGGGQVRSIGWWDRFRHELAAISRNLAAVDRPLVNVNAAHGVGAVIPDTVAAPLPDPANLPLLPSVPLPTPRQDRLGNWRRRASGIVADADAFITHMDRSAAEIRRALRGPPATWDLSRWAAAMDTTAAVSEGNRTAFKYILRSALHNSSAEYHRARRAAGKADADAAALRVMACLGEALAGALRTLHPLVEEIANAARA